VQLLEKINQLKNAHKAVILAHNYQPAEIQDIADFTGDSLGLSIKAAETDAELIVYRRHFVPRENRTFTG